MSKIFCSSSRQQLSFLHTAIVWLTPIALLCLSFFLPLSCLDDSIDESPGLSLRFSTDTLRFDTVFTTAGSATQALRIINPHDQAVELSRVAMKEAAQSMFRLNVDGISGNPVENIRIPAEDSIWVFAEVTIDPNNPLSVSPFIIEEQMIAELNGSQQEILFQAFGQNANYITEENFKGQIGILRCSGGALRLDDAKPYVLFGTVVIDSCELVLPAGTRLHIHGGFVNDDLGFRGDGFLVIGPEAKLRIEGTESDPVVVSGTRLEPQWDRVPGQYGGILLAAGSQANIEHAHLQNGTLGIRVDSAASCTIRQTEIRNTSSSGVLGRHATLLIENSLIADNDRFALEIGYGGNYTLEQVTLANYGNREAAVAMTNFTVIDPDQNIIALHDLSARFNNCILSGSSADELIIVDGTDPGGSDLDIRFDHCLLRVDELLSSTSIPDFIDNYTQDCALINRDDPLFEAIGNQDYHLDTLSIAEDRGPFLPALPIDLDGVMRPTDTVDIGCYEYVPGM